VNCPENVAFTSRKINQSKGKMKLEEWLTNNGNVNKYGVNKTLAIDAAKLADRGIKNKVKEILSRR